MKYISRSPLLIALLLVFVAFGTLGILWIVQPPPTNIVPIATLAPTAEAIRTVAPAATAEPDTYTTSVKLASNVGITLVLPTPWQQLDLTAVTLRDTVSQLALEDAAPGRLLAIENMLAALDPTSTVLVAVLVDNPTPDAMAAFPSLTVVRLPRYNLTLARYLDEVGTALSEAGAVVDESAVDNMIRLDGLPVAFLHYKLESNGAMAVDGQQMATFNRDGTQLILFTFTTPQTRYAELLPIFKQIVGEAQYQ